jgi:hypothetical protein
LDVLKAVGSLDTDADVFSNVRILASEATLKAARDDFLIASVLADHIEAGRLVLRAHTDTASNTMVATDDQLFAILDTVGETAVALGATDSEFITDAYTTCSDRFDTAESFDLRTPGRQRVHTTLNESLSEATADEFKTYLSSLETVSNETVNEVILALIAAARNQEQLYKISKWGEDISIASKATFSREKSEIEEQGLIDTEKIPVDVGRPRLRLLVGSDDLAAVADEEVPSTIQRLS